MSDSLRLYPLFSPEAFDWPLPSDSVTFCYFFSQSDLDSVPILHSQGALQLTSQHRPTTFLISIYVGAEQDSGFEWVEDKGLGSAVFWLGTEGLEGEVGQRLGVQETPQFLVVVGDRVDQRLSTFPEDLRTLIPPEAIPAEITERVTYASMAAYLQGEDTTQVSEAFNDIARSNPQMSLRGVSTVITLLSDRYQLDLSEAVQWFASPRYGSEDLEDIIDINNVTEDMFKRRVRNFCLYKVSAGSSPHEDPPAGFEEAAPVEIGPGHYEELKALLAKVSGFFGNRGKTVKREPVQADPRDAQIMHLTLSLSEKDALIQRLQRELEDRNKEIASLRVKSQPPPPASPAAPSKTPKSSGSHLSIPTAQSAPPVSAPTETLAVAVPKDEFDFWKYGQEEEWDTAQAHPPKFEEIAAAKGLWIVTAETQGIGPSIKDLRMLKQQAKSRKGALPPLSNAPAGPERRVGSHLGAKKTKPMEKVFGSAGKLVAGKG